MLIPKLFIMQDPRPIKRHEALVSFSREHQFGLLLSWKIRQGIARSVDPERISSYINYFFDEELKNHFRVEVVLMLSVLPPHDSMRIQTETEHKEIYALVESISMKPNDVQLMKAFADYLEKHIRFEERTLFNHLQTSMSEKQLEEISGRFSETTDPDLKW